MSELASVLCHFPQREFAIRRLCACDPDFRTLCEDYATATRAIERWSDDEGKAAHYREIIEELENEIQEYLDRNRRSIGAGHSK